MLSQRLLVTVLLLLALVVGTRAGAPRLLDATELRMLAPASGGADAAPRFERPADPVLALRQAACHATTLTDLARRAGGEPCSEPAPEAPVPSLRLLTGLPSLGVHSARSASSQGDGLLVDRQRILQIGPVALDLVAYLSSGLIVGGLLCYTDDGQPCATVLHLHSGIGGIFVNPNPPGADIVYGCDSWAANHGSNVFVPSYRGMDGGQGEPELCLGEADDVANAAILLRGLDVVDPNRLAVIGASLGGCVALKAGVLIPNLRAVLAIAPPTDWVAMINFHRTQFAPATETRCDGSTVSWTAGGPAFADMLDNLICRHPGCSIEAYNARSPIPLVYQSTNPTLVLAASADTLVPVSQQLLWSTLRNDATGAVAVDVRDRCSAPSVPPLAQDALLYVPGAFHLMEDGPVASGLLWVIEQLDARQAPASAGL